MVKSPFASKRGDTSRLQTTSVGANLNQDRNGSSLQYSRSVKAEGPLNIQHVFLIVLENKSYDNTFGSHADPYFLTLRKEGITLENYFGIGHNSLDNYIAIISGQPPNPATQMDCPVFAKFFPIQQSGLISKMAQETRKHFASGDDGEKTFAKVSGLMEEDLKNPNESDQPGATTDGVLPGVGCVYPPQAKTIADQLQETNRYSWRAYMEDMETSCERPELGHFDGTFRKGNKGYATRHNPFAYFSSLTGDRSAWSEWIAALTHLFDTQSALSTFFKPLPASGRSNETQSICQQHERPLKNLDEDLKEDREPLPNLIFITPNLCHDGHTDCDGQGEKGELRAIDGFLGQWLPLIKKSRAFRDGVIIITFDEAEVPRNFPYRPTADTGGDAADNYAACCCGEKAGPIWEHPGIGGPGGGRVGAILISPFVCPGTKNEIPYNHYSLLRSIEGIFGIQSHLAFANQSGLLTFQEGHVFDYRPSTGK